MGNWILYTSRRWYYASKWKWNKGELMGNWILYTSGRWYCHVPGGTPDENNEFPFGRFDLLAPWLQVLLIILKYSAIADLHTFHFTFVQALAFSVFTSRLLATDLNTEINTSNHFVLFRLQSLWNLGAKNSSRLTPPDYNWLVNALSELSLLII
jgi:hypothetical protein